MAFFDSGSSTIRHVNCIRILNDGLRSQRCSECKAYRYTLHTMLSRWKRASDSDVATNRGMISSRANFRYLNTPERKERFKQMRQQISQSERRVKQLQSTLERSVHLRGIQIDKNTSDRFLELMIKHSGEVSTTDTEFQKIFWEQQIKAKACKRPNGIRWHLAVIRWCLYLHHKSSGAYSTLRDSGVFSLPSERTLRDYHHFASSTTGFSKDTDMQLLDLIANQSPPGLAKYLTLVIDEMYIKEGLVFNKKSGALIGFSDLGEINNLMMVQEDLSTGMPARPLAKVMVTFMLRRLFTSFTFVYAQFSAASSKG